MEMYETEEQQVAAIKDWWKKNGKSVIGGAVIGFGLIFGWRAYDEHQLTVQETASSAYEQALTALELDDKAQAQLQVFIDSNSKTNYASLASLKLAGILVKQGEFEKAEQQLNWAIANGSEVVSSIALLRVARLQTQMKKYDDALASLAKITSKAYAAKVAETKGDIYIAQAKIDAARTAYQAAVTAGSMTSRGLQMKLDDLAQPELSLDNVVSVSE